MPIADLSVVSRTLVTLIRDHIAQSPAWLPRPPPKVSPHPPDRLDGQSVGLYLYHAREEGHGKNALPIGPGHPPVRYTPMALSLYYLLTAVSDAEADQATYTEQLLLGCAMKALHDYPSIDDRTVIGAGTPYFETFGLDGGDNRFRVELQPIPFEQAIDYWTASSSQPRLAAYYQVSVIYLEPEHPTSRTGRVLQYGVHTFVTGAPRVDATANSISFLLPGEATPRTLELRPAQVPLDSRFEIVGSDLAGDETRLLLRGADFSRQVEVGPAWGVVATSSRVTAVARSDADGEVVLPGVYSAQVAVVRNRPMPDGTVRRFEQRSNQTPFTITPRVSTPTPLTPDGVTVIPGGPFAHPSLSADDIEVHFRGERLTPGTAGTLAPGEWGAIDAAQLEVRLPTGVPPGVHLVRIVVRGAEGPPAFVEVQP